MNILTHGFISLSLSLKVEGVARDAHGQIPYEVLKTLTKTFEDDTRKEDFEYELRKYPETKWVCTAVPQYDVYRDYFNDWRYVRS